MDNLFYTVVACIMMVLIAYPLWSLLAAICTLITGALLGYEFQQLTFLGMNLKKQDGRLSFFASDQESPSATCLMANPKNHKTGCKILWEVLQNVLTYLLILMIFAALYIGAMQGTIPPEGISELVVFVLFCGMFFFNLLTTIKIIQFVAKSSGDSLDARCYRAYSDVLDQLQNGRRPADLQMEDIDTSSVTETQTYPNQYLLMRYYQALDQGNVTSVAKYIKRFEEINPVAIILSLTPYYYERIFYYAYYARDIGKAEQVMSFIGEHLRHDKDANGLRIYAYYLYYTGKGSKQAMETVLAGLNAVDKLKPLGIAKMERDLLFGLKETIEREGGIQDVF